MVNARIALRWMFVLAALLIAGAAGAQNPPKATVEPESPYAGSSFRLSISHGGEFRVVSGLSSVSGSVRQAGGVATNISIVNGVATHSYGWTFHALAPGEFSIGPFVVESAGQSFTVPAVKGTVRDVPAASGAVIRGTRGLPEGADPNAPSASAPDIFTALECPESVHEGEPFSARTLLYVATNIRGSLDLPSVQYSSHPAFAHINGFRPYQEGEPHRSNVRVNGRTYTVHPIAEELVAAIRPGKSMMGGAELVISSWNGSFRMTAPACEVDVVPLPEAPDDAVDVLVGKVTVGAAIDRAEVQERDAVTLTVRLSGASWLGSASLANLPPIDGLEAFDREDERDYSMDRRSPLMTHTEISRTFRAIRPGEVVIPALKFAVFDPATKAMTTQETQPIALKVNPRTDGSVAAVTTVPSAGDSGTIDRGKARIIDGSKGIVHIDTRPLEPKASSTSRRALWKQPVFVGMHGAALGGALVLWGFAARTRRVRGDSRLSHALAASKRADQSLREAERLAGSQAPPDAFYGALARGLLNGVGAVTGREASGLTLDEADEQLASGGAAAELRSRLRDLLLKCDTMRYAPGGTAAGMQSDLDSARGLLVEIARIGR